MAENRRTYVRILSARVVNSHQQPIVAFRVIYLSSVVLSRVYDQYLPPKEVMKHSFVGPLKCAVMNMQKEWNYPEWGWSVVLVVNPGSSSVFSSRFIWPLINSKVKRTRRRKEIYGRDATNRNKTATRWSNSHSAVVLEVFRLRCTYHDDILYVERHHIEK